MLERLKILISVRITTEEKKIEIGYRSESAILALLEPSKQHWLHEAVRGSKTCEDSLLPFGQEEHPALQHKFCELRENTRTRTMLYKNATQRLKNYQLLFFQKEKGAVRHFRNSDNNRKNKEQPCINQESEQQGRTQHRTWVYTCTPDNSCSCKRNPS